MDRRPSPISPNQRSAVGKNIRNKAPIGSEREGGRPSPAGRNPKRIVITAVSSAKGICVRMWSCGSTPQEIDETIVVSLKGEQ